MDKAYENLTMRLIILIIFCIIIALITKPIFPWLYVERETNGTQKEYYGETAIRIESEENAYFKLMDDDLNNIDICFWFALIFGIIGLIGAVLYKTEFYKFQGCVFLIIGSFVIIFTIMVIIFHWSYVQHIEDYKINLVRSGEKSFQVAFYYNYIPLSMSILMLGFSFTYVITVLPKAIRTIRLSYVYKRAYYQNVYGRLPPPKHNLYYDSNTYIKTNRINRYPPRYEEEQYQQPVNDNLNPPYFEIEEQEPMEFQQNDNKINITNIEARLEIWKEKLNNKEISDETYRDIKRALKGRNSDIE